MTKEQRIAYQKAYRVAHREELKAADRIYRTGRKEKDAVYKKTWRMANKEKISAHMKIYHALHKEERQAYRNAHKKEIAAYRDENGEAIRAYAKAYHIKHKERIHANAKVYRASHQKEIIIRSRQYKYGLSQESFDFLIEKQKQKCAICGKEGWNGHGPHVDHDHVTGNVRGILCNNCNSALGMVGEDAKVARKMADYLDSDGVQ
jgi:hypothetical protein